MITIATLFWDANPKSQYFSRIYDESWVEKLYRGFERNLTVPFRFVCYVDHIRTFKPWAIEQLKIKSAVPGYSDCIQPYEMGVPMILVGLDTLVVGNCDHLAEKCFIPSVRIGLPRDPYYPKTVCNGVALVPGGLQHIANSNGMNDMEWMRKQPYYVLDDVFPEQIVSWHGHAKKFGITEETRIIYFHGNEKMNELLANPIIQRHWI